MKLLIASDIHGSATWCKRLMDAIEAERPNTVVLLGDLLYHGPRNPLPDGYAPMEVAGMLNSMADRIVAVRGNCDSEVDQMVLDFPCMADYTVLLDGQRRLFCTHGHVFDPAATDGHSHSNMPTLPEGSAFLSGHTHVKVNESRDGIWFLNPGSVSLPKDGSHSYALYDQGEFELHELA